MLGGPRPNRLEPRITLSSLAQYKYLVVYAFLEDGT